MTEDIPSRKIIRGCEYMKITTKELRNGTIIVRNAQVLQVISFQNMNDIYRLQVMNIHQRLRLKRCSIQV